MKLIDQKYFRFLPGSIKEKIEKDSINMEDLMCLGNKAVIVLIVSGYDEISGAKKVFESKAYNIGDIKNGKFDKCGLDVAVHETMS